MRSGDGDPVTVGDSSEPDVRRRRSDQSVPRGFAVVNVDVVDDDVAHLLDREASVAGDLHVRASPVDGFVASDDELVPEFDPHVAGEDDPERLRLDHGVAEGSGGRVRRVVVGGVGDEVKAAAFAAERALSEADGAVGEALAVLRPVWVAAPAVVDWVSGDARRYWRRGRRVAVALLVSEEVSSVERIVELPAFDNRGC